MSAPQRRRGPGPSALPPPSTLAAPASPGVLLIPASFHKVQDHLLHAAELCPQRSQLLQQELDPLGLDLHGIQRVPAANRKAVDPVRACPVPS